VGLKANLKTDWDGIVRYQLVIAPRSKELAQAFDVTARSQRDSLSFTIPLFDKAGFEVCKKDIKVRPFVGSGGQIEGLHANDSFYNFECSRSGYKQAERWNLSYVFPALRSDKSAPQPERAAPKPAPAAGARPVANPEPTEGDDKMTGFDMFSGHLETLSGKTFILYRQGERTTAAMWDASAQIGQKAQADIHFQCKSSTDCLIENTANKQAVHARLLR
jgi:hypothetical protein